MLKEITLINFQKHRNRRIEFDKGLNIIVGTSDVGKSAVIRAIRWVVENRPSGDDFRTHHTDETSVEIVTQEGSSVKRVKSKSENYYEVTVNSHTETLKGFGQNIPEQVTKVLNLSSLNMQCQMDPTFLLSDSDSPGKVAQALNAAVDLNIIDDAQTRIAKKYRDVTSKLDYEQESKDKFEKDLEQFTHLPLLKKKISKLEQIDEKISELSGKARAISGIIADSKTILTKTHEISIFLRLEGKYTVLERKHVKHAVLCEKQADLREVIGQIQRIERDIAKIRPVLEFGSLITSLDKKCSRLNEVNADIRTLSNMISSIESVAEDKKHRRKELERWNKAYSDLMPDACPLCGEKVKSKSLIRSRS